MSKYADGVWLIQNGGKRASKICEPGDLDNMINFATMMQYADNAATALFNFTDEVRKQTTKKRIWDGKKVTSYTYPSPRDIVQEVILSIAKQHEDRLVKEVTECVQQ